MHSNRDHSPHDEVIIKKHLINLFHEIRNLEHVAIETCHVPYALDASTSRRVNILEGVIELQQVEATQTGNVFEI